MIKTNLSRSLIVLMLSFAAHAEPASLADMNQPLNYLGRAKIAWIESAAPEVRRPLLARHVQWAADNKRLHDGMGKVYDFLKTIPAGDVETTRDLVAAMAQHAIDHGYAGAFIHYFPYDKYEPGVRESIARAYFDKGHSLGSLTRRTVNGATREFLVNEISNVMRLATRPYELEQWLEVIRTPGDLDLARRNAVRAFTKTPALIPLLFKRSWLDDKDPVALPRFAEEYADSAMNFVIRNPYAMAMIAAAAQEPLRSKLLDRAYAWVETPLQFVRIHQPFIPAQGQVIMDHVDRFVKLEPTVKQARAVLAAEPDHANAPVLKAYLAERMARRPIRSRVERLVFDPKAFCIRHLELVR